MSNKDKNRQQRAAKKRERNKKKREQKRKNPVLPSHEESSGIAPQQSVVMRTNAGSKESLAMLKEILPTIPNHKQVNPTTQLMGQFDITGNGNKLSKVQAIAHEKRAKQGLSSEKVHIFPRKGD